METNLGAERAERTSAKTGTPVEHYQHHVELHARKWKQMPFITRMLFMRLTSDNARPGTRRICAIVRDWCGPASSRLWKRVQPWAPWWLGWCHYVVTRRRFPPAMPSDWQPLAAFAKRPVSAAAAITSSPTKQDTESV